ncbi:fimbrial protein [Cupriavidus pauculus]|uniref:fimbrial protein n=1 Tax=Cupriavidus pauculus TaxID=82633 RepID=UPI001EE22C27|nr:DUF1120 domain-containing protein [Cupriavidus pauculus]GJG93726.1 hypothetical protein CBA19C6_04575 [Cupriavidus pauculus]
MKDMHRIAVTGLLILGASTCALGAESADLRMGGTIRPSACAISLNNDGVVDLGTIPSSTLNAQGMKAMATINTVMTPVRWPDAARHADCRQSRRHEGTPRQQVSR